MTKIEAKQAVSPDDLLKAAVTGKTEPQPESATAAAVAPDSRRRALPSLTRQDLHRFAPPVAALAIGAVLGGGVMAFSRSAALPNDAVVALSTTLDAGRTETARLGGDIAQLHKVLADLRASTDTARKDANARSSALGERLAQLDKNLNAKTAALGERLEQVEREQNARIAALATQLDRRAAAPAAKAEPTQTGSLPESRSADAKISETKIADAKVTEARLIEPKPADAKLKSSATEKPAIIDAWALRDIYDGTAILEDRRRHLVEVAPGDILPGVGRVEGVERRGREWVVVTRQGLVTPQPW
ncbi:hypothetical protein ACRAWG_17230 [Methylobacterium sp. P31]